MAKFSTLFCLLAALFIGGSIADTCISLPSSLGRGKGCGGSISCSYGLFCNEEGVCVPQIKEGEDCEDNAVCELGLDCRGPDDHRRCVAPVHPGQDCSAQYYQSGPYCGTEVCSNGRCINGDIGDTCFEDDDCQNELTCTLGLCTGIAIGSACDSNSCVIGAYCNFVTEKCTALPTSGNCTVNNECAYGYICTLITEEADFNQCLARYSVVDGGYCQQHAACESHRCYDNHCAAKSSKYCFYTGDDNCADDEVCTCDGGMRVDGFGTCSSNSCFKHAQAYEECRYTHCRSTNYFNGSCIQMNCEKEYLKNDKCGSGSTLFVSLLSVSLIAFFVSFLGKHF